MQLRTAIAATRTKHVARETFAVNAHEHIGFARDVSFNQCQMMLAVRDRAIEVKIEVAIVGRHFHDLDALDELLARAAKFN